MSYKIELQSNNAELQAILDTVNNLPEVGSGVEQATPEITVSSSGLITATAGNKSATKQLTTKSAQTITPGTSNKTIASGTYLTGTQTIKGDSNLIASNIKSGVSIFGVNGSYEGNSSGGSSIPSNPSASANAINFRDYDGTILYSYTKDEALALISLPALPTQPGLICQGWNWSLENMKECIEEYGTCDIGATYITDDGKTRIYITLQEGRTSPMLGCCPNGTVTVDWGDGSTPDTLTGTSISSVKWTPTHNYASAGDYIITLSVDGSMEFYGVSSTNQYSGILRHSSGANGINHAYRNSVKKIEIGSGIEHINNYSFNYCYSLSSITIPNGITSIGNNAFNYCYSLVSITIPNGTTSIGNNAFYYCYAMNSISLPNGITSIGSTAFSYCASLQSITVPGSVTNISSTAFAYCYSIENISLPNNITDFASKILYYCYSLSKFKTPDNITSIGENAFYYNYALSHITIPSSVTSIGARAFYYCYSLAKIRFKPTTPPTVSSSNAFTNIPTDCIISVPTGTLSAYISATNYPSNSTYTYIEEN